MSVSVDDPLGLPPFRLPERFGGTDRKTVLFEMDRRRVGEALALEPDRPPHHVVAPSGVMPLAGYRAALAATRGEWSETP